MVTALGVFLFVFAVYETLEYLFCYNEEKKEQSKVIKMLKRAYRRTRQHLYGDSAAANSSETEGLLCNAADDTTGLHDNGSGEGAAGGEVIPLNTFQNGTTVNGRVEGHTESDIRFDLDLRGERLLSSDQESLPEMESSFSTPVNDNH